MGYEIRPEQALREVITGDPHELVVAKDTSVITAAIKRYIDRSPFVCLATHAADGSSDVSPRGDAPGFVHVLDEKTLVIPDRPGNRRFDSVVNIIGQPQLSLLFMIPGVLDTVRINGTGVVSTDPELLGRFPVNGKLPKIVIVVTVTDALGHCSKAFRRSKLWQSDYRADAGVPSLAELMSDHLGLDAQTTEMLELGIDDDARNNMY
jgi:PPOX class probable FMN-dependent enzyme